MSRPVEATAALAAALLMLSACSRTTPESDAGSGGPSAPAEEQMERTRWTGVFRFLWGDPAPPGGTPRRRYHLVTDQGRVITLLVADSLLTEFGGARGLTGRRVSVVGREDPDTKVVRVHFIRLD